MRVNRRNRWLVGLDLCSKRLANMVDDAQQREDAPPTPLAPPVKIGRFDLRDRPKFPLMFGLGCLAVVALSFSLSTSATFTLLTAVGGITGFLYAQHARDIQLFRELFREFNARYGALDDRLNEIRNRPEGQLLNSSDKGVL